MVARGRRWEEGEGQPAGIEGAMTVAYPHSAATGISTPGNNAGSSMAS